MGPSATSRCRRGRLLPKISTQPGPLRIGKRSNIKSQPHSSLAPKKQEIYPPSVNSKAKVLYEIRTDRPSGFYGSATSKTLRPHLYTTQVLVFARIGRAFDWSSGQWPVALGLRRSIGSARPRVLGLIGHEAQEFATMGLGLGL